MIRVNLISEAVPQARGEPNRLSSVAQAGLLVVCLAVSVGWLAFDYLRTESAVTQVKHELALQHVALTRLDRLRAQVATFQQQKAAIDHRIALIVQLESNRTQGQQLLESIADTVNRTPLLWLTGLSRKGQALTIEGRAGSIDAVATLISQLRSSGRFGQIQMKTTQQKPNSPITTFSFGLSAVFQTASPTPASMTKPGTPQ
jgi:Tfp pilus assembly protein PilN